MSLSADVERGLGPGAVVEVLCRLRVERRRPSVVEHLPALRKALETVHLGLAQRPPADAELVRQQSVTRGYGRQPLHQDVDRVERRTAVVPGVHVALAGPHLQMEGDEAACREPELGLLGACHPTVEDDAGVGAALVRLEEVHDRVAADLLLAVRDDSDVHRQRVPLPKELGGLQERVELTLVVGDAARVEPAVALRELERRRLPEVERRGRLDVEVTVDHHGRRIAAAVRVRGNVADDEIPLAVGDELGLPTHALDEVTHPFGCAPHVGLMRGIRADARNRDELAQLIEPGLLHGRRVYVDPARILARACPRRSWSRLCRRVRTQGRLGPLPRTPQPGHRRPSSSYAEVY